MVCDGWKKRLVRYARMSLDWFIHTWARMKFCFRHFTVKKTSFPLPAEKFSCLYMQWVAYKYAVCRVFADKISLRTEISCVSWENKGFGICLEVNFVRIKNWFPTKTIPQLSISDVKMLQLTGNDEKAYKVRNFFCLDDRQKSRHFFKLDPWRTVKMGACILRFSALKRALSARAIASLLFGDVVVAVVVSSGSS